MADEELSHGASWSSVAELEEFCILSDLTITPGEETRATPRPHLPREVRAVLAASPERRHDRGAPGALRALRGGRHANRMKLLLSLALPIYALDQATKWWILQKSGGEIGWQEPVIPGFFDLCYLANTGAAFSSFHGRNNIFVVISLVALVGLLIATVRNAFPERLNQLAVGCLVGGILGNVTDRLLHGHVVDFLLFDLHVRFANPWPAFNVADSAICTAVGLLLISSFFPPKPAPQGREK